MPSDDLAGAPIWARVPIPWRQYMKHIICIGYTGLAAFSDFRTGTVPLWLLLSGSFAGLLWILTTGEVQSGIIGMVPGIALIVLSRAVKEHIGTGDGILLTGVGMLTGWLVCMQLLLIACILSAVVGVALMKCRKKTIRYSLPWIPFLLAAELLLFLTEAIS